MVLYSRKYQVLRHSACSKRNSVFQLLQPTHLVASNLDQLLGYGSAIMRPMIRSSIRCSISPAIKITRWLWKPKSKPSGLTLPTAFARPPVPKIVAARVQTDWLWKIPRCIDDVIHADTLRIFADFIILCGHILNHFILSNPHEASMRPQTTVNPLSTGGQVEPQRGYGHENGWQTLCKWMANGWQMVGKWLVIWWGHKNHQNCLLYLSFSHSCRNTIKRDPASLRPQVNGTKLEHQWTHCSL